MKCDWCPLFEFDLNSNLNLQGAWRTWRVTMCWQWQSSQSWLPLIVCFCTHSQSGFDPLNLVGRNWMLWTRSLKALPAQSTQVWVMFKGYLVYRNNESHFVDLVFLSAQLSPVLGRLRLDYGQVAYIFWSNWTIGHHRSARHVWLKIHLAFYSVTTRGPKLCVLFWGWMHAFAYSCSSARVCPAWSPNKCLNKYLSVWVVFRRFKIFNLGYSRLLCRRRM